MKNDMFIQHLLWHL